MTFSERDILRGIVRDSFFEFVKEFWHTLVAEEPVFNWHVELMCNELQEAAERVFKGQPKEFDYLFNVPPGSTKSTICSQMFPAWVWTNMPTAQFICGSYAHAIALKDSIRTRDVVQSETYQELFPHIQLREDQNAKGLFINTQGGYRYSVGVNGAVTGYHGHFLIVDDPLNPEESYSEAELKVANRWMNTTLPTRKVNKEMAVTILVQQRLHQSDPSGMMIDRLEKDGLLRHICLPGEKVEGAEIKPPQLAEYYDDDGLLDPVRLPRKALDALRIELGEYGYASQILQNPVPLGGGMFKVAKLKMELERPKRFLRLCRSWDKAGTKDGGAWTVGLLMGIDEKNEPWILDVVRRQVAATERENLIVAVAEEDDKNEKITVEILLEIEGGSGGKESGEGTVRNLEGHSVFTFHPTGDKESRAYPLASQMGNGTVHCLVGAWTREFTEELRYFPHSRYKDQVDAASGAYNRLARKKKRIGGW